MLKDLKNARPTSKGLYTGLDHTCVVQTFGHCTWVWTDTHVDNLHSGPTSSTPTVRGLLATPIGFWLSLTPKTYGIYRDKYFVYRVDTSPRTPFSVDLVYLQGLTNWVSGRRDNYEKVLGI